MTVWISLGFVDAGAKGSCCGTFVWFLCFPDFEMNPANFANHGGAMPAGHKQVPQMQGQQKNESAQMLMKHVAQALQGQGPLTGWRATVPIQERVGKVYQM